LKRGEKTLMNIVLRGAVEPEKKKKEEGKKGGEVLLLRKGGGDAVSWHI